MKHFEQAPPEIGAHGIGLLKLSEQVMHYCPRYIWGKAISDEGSLKSIFGGGSGLGVGALS